MNHVQRLNSRPVFIHGLQGGGTGILWNFITSHPDFLGPRYETNQIFTYDWWRFAKALPRPQKYGYVAPNMLALIPLAIRNGFSPRRWRIFSYDDYTPRNPDSYSHPGLAVALDQRLHALKVDHAIHPRGDLENEKSRGQPYTREEIERARLAAKNIEGLCFLYPFFKATYPDAKFISLTRNGLASCESKLRHGRAQSVEHAAEVYRSEMRYMIDLTKRDPECMLLRYEDLMGDPLAVIRRIYAFLGVTLTAEQEFRMATREFIGRERTALAGRGVQAGKEWYSQAELVDRFVQSDVNRRALERIPRADRRTFLQIAGDVMRELRYA